MLWIHGVLIQAFLDGLTLTLVWNNSLGLPDFQKEGHQQAVIFHSNSAVSPSSLMVFCQHITLKFSKSVQVYLLSLWCWASIRNTSYLNMTMALFAKTVTLDFPLPPDHSHSLDCSISSSEGHIYKSCYSDSLSWTVLHNYFSVSHGIILPKPLCGFSYAFAGFGGCSTAQRGGKYWMCIKTQPLLLQRVTQATLYNLDAQ